MAPPLSSGEEGPSPLVLDASNSRHSTLRPSSARFNSPNASNARTPKSRFVGAALDASFGGPAAGQVAAATTLTSRNTGPVIEQARTGNGTSFDRVAPGR